MRYLCKCMLALVGIIAPVLVIADDLVVQNAWIRAAPPGMTMLAGYYIIVPVAFMLIVRIKIPGIKINVIIKDIFLMIGIATAVYFFAGYVFGLLAINNVLKILVLCLLVIIPFLLIANWILDLKFQKGIILSIFAKK